MIQRQTRPRRDRVSDRHQSQTGRGRARGEAKSVAQIQAVHADEVAGDTGKTEDEETVAGIGTVAAQSADVELAAQGVRDGELDFAEVGARSDSSERDRQAGRRASGIGVVDEQCSRFTLDDAGAVIAGAAVEAVSRYWRFPRARGGRV